jgi:hypothetical protein
LQKVSVGESAHLDLGNYLSYYLNGNRSTILNTAIAQSELRDRYYKYPTGVREVFPKFERSLLHLPNKVISWHFPERKSHPI